MIAIAPGRLPLRLLMDDEEDDVLRPVSRCWGTLPFRDVKYEDRATQTAGHAAGPRRDGVLPCGVPEEPRALFHDNAGFRSHFPALFEPVGGRGHESGEDGREEEEEGPSLAARLDEDPEMSVETQIGRKLREIGDKFQQEHLQLFVQHQRDQLPAWWRLSTALYHFLFQREGVAPPPRGGQR